MLELKKTLNRWLLVCARSLKGKPVSDVTPEVIEIWASVLQSAGVKPEEVGPAFERLLAKETFFPAPAEFLKHWRKSSTTVAWTDPVAVIEDGALRIGSKAVCDREGVRYLPTDHPDVAAIEAPVKALPSPEQTERAARKTRRAPVDPDEAAEALAKARRF